MPKPACVRSDDSLAEPVSPHEDTEVSSLDLDRVGVVIPALNEARGIAALVPMLRTLGVRQIAVGDNGSTDGTGDVARDLGCDVAREVRRGYGAACWAAMQRLDPCVEVVVFLDADLADDPGCLPHVAGPVLRHEADLVIGSRRAAGVERGAMSLPQRFGNRLATTLIRWGWGHRYHDLGPFRAIRRSALDAMQMQDRAFGWTVEMQVRAVEMGLRICETPVPYRRRVGRSKISGTFMGVLRAGYWILRTIGGLYWTRSRRLMRRSAGSGPT